MRKIVYKFQIVLVLTIFVSCTKLLEINPKQSVDSSEALNSKEGVEAALIGVYARLQSTAQYGGEYVFYPEALADNVYHSRTNSQYVNIALNARGSHLNSWQSNYYGINQANLVIQAVESMESDLKWKAGVLGQAYFLRALTYHNLAKIYGYDPTAIYEPFDKGSVPIVLKGVIDVNDIEYNARASWKDVYDLIESDLTKSYNFLKDIKVGSEPHKVSAAAAAALHSRVSLFRGEYTKSIEKATEALQNSVGNFMSKENYVAGWRSEVNPESIFELRFTVSENIGATYSIRATYTTRAFLEDQQSTTHGVLVVDPSLYSLFQDNDIRKELISYGLGANAQRLETTKFISKNGVKDLDNVPIIRVSEVILNRAESYYRADPEGNRQLALMDLNKIRERSGLGPVDLSGEALLSEILLQRRLELAFEGHRWFDLKRLGHDVIKETGSILFTDYRILPSIPIREIESNDRLIQNEGY